jgi:hypothetical protein
MIDSAGVYMGFDKERYNTPATNGDVSGLAIDVVTALYSITDALEKVAAKVKVDISDDVESIQKEIDSLTDLFDTLTGYVEDEK